MTTFAGTIIAERYRLEAMIGEGATATVWRAIHVQLEKPVAVKFIHAEGRDAATMADRFLREARLAAAVRHRMVVDIMDFGTTPAGQPFMVMEYLEGTPFDERLRQEPKLGAADVLRLLDLVLSGLAAIHDAGVVHRDIKPGNIFLVQDADGYFPKLLDFGISRAVDPDASRLQSALTTKSGWLFGTPRYMSPEQARGMLDIDHRADIYSIGVILYEALAGRLPYDAEHMGDLLMQVTKGGADPLLKFRPDLGTQLSALLEKAMAVRREDRYPTARLMRDDLRAATLALFPLAAIDAGAVPLEPALESTGPRASLVPTLAADEEAALADAVADSDTHSFRQPEAVRAAPRLGRRVWLFGGAGLVVIVSLVTWAITGDDNAPASAVAPADQRTPPAVSSPAPAVPAVVAPAMDAHASPDVVPSDAGLEGADDDRSVDRARSKKGEGRPRRGSGLLREPGF